MVYWRNSKHWTKQDEQEMNSLAFHWVYVRKDDNVFVQTRKSKNKICIREIGDDADGYGQHRWHYLTLLDKDGSVLRKCDFESHCGHDRGPKLRSLVRNLILNGMGGKYSKKGGI